MPLKQWSQQLSPKRGTPVTSLLITAPLLLPVQVVLGPVALVLALGVLVPAAPRTPDAVGTPPL